MIGLVWSYLGGPERKGKIEDTVVWYNLIWRILERVLHGNGKVEPRSIVEKKIKDDRVDRPAVLARAWMMEGTRGGFAERSMRAGGRGDDLPLPLPFPPPVSLSPLLLHPTRMGVSCGVFIRRTAYCVLRILST
jgi:hypothetical protein